MFKKILKKAIIILIGMIKSGLVGVLVAIMAGVILEIIPEAILFIVFLLPAMFLYHLGKALNLKNRTCDIFYFVGFIPVLSLYIYGGCTPSPSGDGGHLWCRLIACILFFSGTAIYLAEVYFRNRAILKNMEQTKNPGI